MLSPEAEPAFPGKLQEDLRSLLRHLDEGKDPYPAVGFLRSEVGEVDAGIPEPQEEPKARRHARKDFSGHPSRPLQHRRQVRPVVDDRRRGSRVLPNATRGRHVLQHVWP